MINNSKQLQILASPLQRIADATESSASSLTLISDVVININTSALEIVKELKKQTGVLLDIKGLLSTQNKNLTTGTAAKGGPAAGSFKPMKEKEIGLTALMILGVAGAIVGAAAIFTLMPLVSIPQLLTALAVAVVLMLIAPVYVKISESLGKVAKDMAGGKKGTINPSNTSSLFAIAGVTLLAIVGMAASLVIAGALFTMMPAVTGAQLLTALAIAIVMIPMAFAFSMVLKATKGIEIKGLLFAALAFPIMAWGIKKVAEIWSTFPTNPMAPDPIWVLKSALAIGLFSVGFYFIMKAIKRASLKEILFGSLAIPLMAVAINLIAYIFESFPKNPVAPDPIWVLKSALAIGLFAIGFYFVMKAIKGANIKELIFGAIAMPLLAWGIRMTAEIWDTFPKAPMAPDPIWALKAGLALLIFAIPFYIVSKAIKGLSFKELMFMTIAIPVVAFGVLATAFIFQGLNGMSYAAPEPEWTLKAGLAVVIFGAMLYASSKTIGKLSVGDMVKGLVGIVVSAFGVVATAWIFQMLPGNLIAPSHEWTVNAALALGIMGAAIAVMGLAVVALTPATLLLGALGIIVAAVVIVAVGWILAGLAPVMPKLLTVSKGITDVLLAPINGIIDVFARFKNEIGIDNMLDLAIGVAALGGAWLIFSAAVGGASVVGGIGTAIGGIFEGIGKLFGGDTPSPIDLLERLGAAGPNITKLAKPIADVGKGFSMINVASGGVMKAFGAIVNFNDKVDAKDLKSKATSLRSLANSYVGIANASNAMNVKAINATTNMFKALDDLAKNGGESAMAVLAEKLMLAVKELSGTVVNLEKSVEKQGTATGGFGDALSGAIETVKETVTGVKKDVAQMNQEAKDTTLDLEPLIKAIQELEARFDSAIKVIDVTEA